MLFPLPGIPFYLTNSYASCTTQPLLPLLQQRAPCGAPLYNQDLGLLQTRRESCFCLLPSQLDNDLPVAKGCCLLLLGAQPVPTPGMSVALTTQSREEDALVQALITESRQLEARPTAYRSASNHGAIYNEVLIVQRRQLEREALSHQFHSPDN